MTVISLGRDVVESCNWRYYIGRRDEKMRANLQVKKLDRNERINIRENKFIKVFVTLIIALYFV